MGLKTACETCLIRNAALCSVLPPQGLQRMERLTVRKRVPAGRTIDGGAFQQDGIATIVSGVVKQVKGLSDGRQQIVALQFAGDFIGDPFGGGHGVSSEAATDVELCCLSRTHFDAISAEHPQMSKQLMRHTLAELDAARDWMLLLGRKTAEERVASLFLLLAERQERMHCSAARTSDASGVVRIALPISRTDIADFLGLTIETVSRQLKRLKDLGVIRLEGQRSVIVTDLAALRRQAEREQE